MIKHFNLFIFASMYFMYIFLSMILLLNLLIALLGSTFSKTQEQATLQGRMAYARIVLRLELIAEFFEFDTRAGRAHTCSHLLTSTHTERLLTEHTHLTRT